MFLAHDLLTAKGANPSQAVLFFHGILGSRSNWRTIARRLVESRPAWAAVLVDLRIHGDSVGFPPPHTLATAAADVARLVPTLALPARAVVGHSFGGKVALALVDDHDTSLAHLVLVDSMPGAREGGRGSESTLAVVAMLRALPARYPSRDAFVADVVARGQSEPLARWLAMNLERDPDHEGFRQRLDLDAVESLLDDYFARDLWHVLEAPRPSAGADAGADAGAGAGADAGADANTNTNTRADAGIAIDVVIGGASTVYDTDDRARAARAAARGSRVHVHTLEGAGHWVHVDAPDALLDILVEALDRA